MNISKLSQKISGGPLLDQMSEWFKGDKLEQLARETGFVMRSTSRLGGRMFLDLNLVGFADGGSTSLSDKCEYLHEAHGISMTKKSLDERYNTHAVAFMRACFGQALSRFLEGAEGVQGVGSRFTGVFVTDSTSFQLPAGLAAFYASNAGSTSGASVKIHYCFELLKGTAAAFRITDGKGPDTGYWQGAQAPVAAGALYLADLGYYKLPQLAAYSKGGAHWVSRYKAGTVLHAEGPDGALQPLDMGRLLARSGGGAVYRVYAGKEERLPARLFVRAVPEAVRQQRLGKLRARTANQSKRKKAYRNTDIKKLLCGYDLYLADLGEGQVGFDTVAALYGLRWQIELLFKAWKGLFHIDRAAKMSIFRFECYLYAKLISLLLCNYVQACLREDMHTGPALELSEWKAMKYLKKNSKGCAGAWDGDKNRSWPF